MSEPVGPAYGRALQHFHVARVRADLEKLVARVRGRHDGLLPFDQVRQQLRGNISDRTTLREIPVDAIVGSVGRYHDFTRSFLPLSGDSGPRWAGIEMVFETGRLPPIEVYQVGDAYFVIDGNHRVSVARDRDVAFIEAYVTEVKTRVPLSREDNPDDLFIKAGYANFLAITELDRTRPEVDFSLTVPARYRHFLDEIAQQRQTRIEAQGADVSYEDAAVEWCDHVFLPVIEEIEQRGILRDFPGRTAADLYAWLIRYRHQIEEIVGWEPEPSLALTNLVELFSPTADRVMERTGRRLRADLVPKPFTGGPKPGQWRAYWHHTHRDDRLFSNILVGIDGSDQGWRAAEQAWRIAQREDGRVHGLHVVQDSAAEKDDQAQSLMAEFTRRRERTGSPGRLSVEAGNVEDKLVGRTRWFDLVVLPLNHPPKNAGLRRNNGLRALISHCPRPLLLVPGAPVDFQHALLAYDGSRKAHEALFVGAYLAGHWELALTVIGVVGARSMTTDKLQQAIDYLHNVGVSHAVIALGTGGDNPELIGAALEEALEESRADLLIMGGYGRAPLLEAVTGSALDATLRRVQATPILICR